MSGLSDFEEHFTSNNLSIPDEHVFRMYSDLDDITEWQTEFNSGLIKNMTTKGKIIWFDVKPYNWTKCAYGGCNDQWKTLAAILVDISPHRAFVSIGHEVDHVWPGVTGTNEDYVKMSQTGIDLVREKGGWNAVWKFVVSNQIWDVDTEGAACWECALERWPGDAYVDWLGMNMYMKYASDNGNGNATYVYGETYFTTEMGHSVEFVLKNMSAKFTQATESGRNFTGKPWALSTVGVHDSSYDVPYNDTLGNNNLGVPDKFRIEFMKEWKTLLNSGNFSRFKMWAYFDDQDCVIDDTTVESFHALATSDVFTTNHKC